MNKYEIQNKMFNFYCMNYIMKMHFNSKRSAESLRNLQNKKVRKLVKRAYEIPFYRDRFDKAGVKPEQISTKEDLRLLPVLTKAEYREWMNEELKKPTAKYFKLTHTSGSTGIPTTNIYPPKEYAQHYMMDMFCWMGGGYNPFFGKTLTCAPGDASVGQNSLIQKIGILRRECFNMSWGRDKIIEKINTYKPDFLLGYSAELSYIAQYALENSLPCHKPKFYCAGGEHVMGEQMRILYEVFGKGMINYYGCTEMADFAYRKPGENGYEVIGDCVAINVKTDEGIKTEGTGSILATPLYRLYYPLINYEMGDIISLTQKEGKDYISEICGREQDIFFWKSGKRTTHKDIWLISRELEDIYQIRFIQESYENITIEVVKDSHSSKSNSELEDYLRNQYAKLFDDDVEISFNWLDAIPPDPNGKIRNMIRRIEK